MKYVFLFLSLLWLFWWVFAYQQQWCTDYQESFGTLTFATSEQCIIVLDGFLEQYDILTLQWTLEGQGILGYGFLVGQQIIPGEFLQVSQSISLDKVFVFSQSPVISQLPGQAHIVLVMQGQLRGSLRPEMHVLSFGEKIIQGWKEFWTFDTFKPYTINLLYWPKLSGKNANKFWYWIFGLVVFGIVVFAHYPWRKKLQYLWFIALWLWLLYDIRMSLEMMKYYRDDYRSYITQTWSQQILRDRGDFYRFVDFAQQTFTQLWLQPHEQILFLTDNTWPFPGSMKYFLYPYDVQIHTWDSRYYIVYGSQSVRLEDNHLIVSGQDLGSWTVSMFAPYAFIFVQQ